MTKPKAMDTAPLPSQRFVCVHGHFYQPPRENPWLEIIERQESAAPYHDWNDRITAECYAPNGASRITDKQDRIVRIVNNYSRMSFNFGPTLLSWLQDNAPRSYRMILDADRISAQRYSGHGSAMAQIYNHIILPLASERDARTQIRWGIADFRYRFGRDPEGMWLPETAVSRATLDLLAQEGIRFTLLAPHQCARVRPLGKEDADWQETQNATVDPRHPYVVRLDEGRSLAVFFYDGPGSRAIAFEGLLNSGENFARRLASAFDHRKEPQLSHVATDGESYGHHHPHGEMALSSAMHWMEENHEATLTNYAEFLSNFPPQYEAEIFDDSSWSCAHGIERWRSDCGCNGGKADWNQQWRAPLREALDRLRDAVTPLSESLASGLLKDLWAARDEYIHVVLDRSPASTEKFFRTHALRELTAAERITVLELMELQRHEQLMYTSCGWFFDDIAGIETVQIIAYAARVLQLAEELFGAAGATLELQFLASLAKAKSNDAASGTGADVYRRPVARMRIGLEQVGAHYAISSLFRTYPKDGQLFCYDLHRISHETMASGRGRVAIGQTLIRSRITEETVEISFAVLHLGDQNLSAAVKRFLPEDQTAFDDFAERIRLAVRRADLPEVIRLIDRFFGSTSYSLTSLFSDEQRRILSSILNLTLSEVEDSLKAIYKDHASLLHFLSESGIEVPPELALTAGFAINASLRHCLEAQIYDAVEVARLLNRAVLDKVSLDSPLLAYVGSQRMKRAMVRLEESVSTPAAPGALHEAVEIARSLNSLPFEVNLWQAQNIWNDLLRRGIADWPEDWKLDFKTLGEALNIAVDQLVVEEGVTVF